MKDFYDKQVDIIEQNLFSQQEEFKQSFSDILNPPDGTYDPDKQKEALDKIEELEKNYKEKLEKLRANTRPNWSDINKIKTEYNLTVPDIMEEDLLKLKALEFSEDLLRDKEDFIKAQKSGNPLYNWMDPAERNAVFGRFQTQALSDFDTANEEAINKILKFDLEDFGEQIRELTKLNAQIKAIEKVNGEVPDELRRRFKNLRTKMAAYSDSPSLSLTFTTEEMDRIVRDLTEMADDIDASSRGFVDRVLGKFGIGKAAAAKRRLAQMVRREGLDVARKPSDVVAAAIEQADDIRRDAKELKRINSELKALADVGDPTAIRELEVLRDTLLTKQKGKLLKSGGALFKGAKEGMLAFRLAKFAGPQIVVAAIQEVVMFTIGNAIVQGWNAKLAARQSVKIIPLRVGKLPYTAGIKGHQGAVVGDQPGWMDVMITKTIDPSTSSVPAIAWLGALNGVEVPDYGLTEVDQKWIDLYKDSITEEDNPTE